MIFLNGKPVLLGARTLKDVMVAAASEERATKPHIEKVTFVIHG